MEIQFPQQAMWVDHARVRSHGILGIGGENNQEAVQRHAAHP